MFTPISWIIVHIVSEVLIQHPIEHFYLAIQLWVKCCVKISSPPSKTMFLEAFHKLGFFITNNDMRHSWCLTHISNNNLVESKVVVRFFVGTIFANLKN